MPANNAIDINILDKTYQVACPADEEPLLRQAAEYLNEQMRGIRDKGQHHRLRSHCCDGSLKY